MVIYNLFLINRTLKIEMSGKLVKRKIQHDK